MSLGQDFKVDLEARVSLGQDFKVDLEARVSLGRDFKVDLKARVSLGWTLRFHRDCQIGRRRPRNSCHAGCRKPPMRLSSSIGGSREPRTRL